MNRYLQEQARDAISRAQHTTRKEIVDLEPGTWVMYFRQGKVTRGAIGAPSKSGLWLGTRPCHHDRGRSTMEWIGAFHDRTNRCCLGVARKQADAVKERYRLPL